MSAVGETSADEGPWAYRSGLRPVDFPRTGWGHRGYEEAAVDDFVSHAEQELTAANTHIDDLRLEVDRLHRYIRRQWAAVAAAESGPGGVAALGGSALGSPGGSAPGGSALGSAGAAASAAGSRSATPAAQARAVLTQAQEIAERRLAEAADRMAEADRTAAARLAHADREVADRLAEADEVATRRIRQAELTAADRLDRVDGVADEVLGDARREALLRRARAQEDAARLLAVARSRYEDIVIRAHQRADQAAEQALHDFEHAAAETADASRARAALEMKAAYLRTFAKVSRTALQAALEITGREFDRLLGATAAVEPARLAAYVGVSYSPPLDQDEDPATPALLDTPVELPTQSPANVIELNTGAPLTTQ